MDTRKPGRVALLSIHPQYAQAIIQGTKTIEFRKRTLAEDITHVIVYATVPTRAIIGYFRIDEQEITTPANLWKLHRKHGGIQERDFFEYYARTDRAVGIKIAEVTPLQREISLEEGLGIPRPPQCVQYLPAKALEELKAAV